MKLILQITICFFILLNAKAQDTQKFTLSEIIEISQAESPQVKLAEIRQSNAYWRNQSFLADYKPQIDIDLLAPNLNRSIQSVTLPDGTASFIRRSLINSSAGVSLSQNISSTGARVFATTGIERLDILKTNAINASTAYLSNPINIGFVQPLFAFNELKWNKRIQPLIFEESKARYSEDMEAVASQAVSRFFELLIAQLNLSSAYNRKEVADTLYQLGQGRYNVGNISESELLQLELSVMNADADVSRNKLNVQTSTEELRNFLGVQEEIRFELESPLEIPEVEIDEQRALSFSKLNRSRILELQRILLQAERDVEETKAATGLNGELAGTFGVTGDGPNINQAYGMLLDQEQLQLRLRIPIADWGKSKAQYEIAKSNYELIELNTQLETVNFEREVIINAQQFSLVKDNVRLSKRSYEATQKRYDLSQKRYLIGKVDITELMLAENEQEEQRKRYIESIRDYWLAYYKIRSLTLYDFISEKHLLQE
jgi:outer membrane protein TolC